MAGTVPSPAGPIRVQVDGAEVTVDSPVPIVFVALDGKEIAAPAGKHGFTL